MKVRSGKIGYPLYCDAGPYEGDMRIDLNIRLYLSPEEYASYEGTESLQMTLTESGDGGLRTGSTAELSAGDVVTTGEAALAAGRPAGWEPVRGGLAEVRVHEHGTRPSHYARPAARLESRASPGQPQTPSGKEEGKTS